MGSRRAINSTDESGVSLSSSTVHDAHLGFRYLKATELQDVSVDTVLQRSLTLRSIISTTSSFAKRYEEAAARPELQVFQEIGQGLQGTIFEQVGLPLVLKMEKPQNASALCSLINEFAMHRQVHDAFYQYSHRPGIDCNVSVPSATKLFYAEDNEVWSTLLSKLPMQHQVRSNIVEMERVLPLPKVIRQALIDKFYPFPTDNEQEISSIRQNVLDLPSNKHCLVRPYLGVRKKTYTEGQFSLRNFILGADDLQQLNFDIQELVMTLGKAYAIMQWGGWVNGDDVEFVFGSSATTGPDEGIPHFQHRKIGLYLIDFGQCDKVNMEDDPQVVYQAFKGAMVTGDNACFIPNHRHTPQLFEIFKDAYSTTARRVLSENPEMEDTFDIEEFMSQYQEYVEDFL